jgi:hypothetical protein
MERIIAQTGREREENKSYGEAERYAHRSMVCGQALRPTITEEHQRYQGD